MPLKAFFNHLQGTALRSQHALLVLLGCALLACVVHVHAHAQAPDNAAEPEPGAALVSAQGVVLLGNAPTVNLAPAVKFYLDTAGQLTQDDVEALPNSSFAAVAPGQSFLTGRGALWLTFDIANSRADADWRLVFPLPGVEDVLVYYRGADGKWVTQQAGATRAISSWTQPGLHPIFLVPHGISQQTRYFTKIKHGWVPYSSLPRVVTDAQLLVASSAEHMLLGVYFGLAALAILLALANTAAYRDSGFGSYAAYIALFTLTQGMFTGVAGLYWWPEWPELNRGLTFVLTLTTAAATWFVRTVVVPRRFSKALDIAMLTLIALMPLAGLFDLLAQTRTSFAVFNLLISADVLVLLAAAGVALFSGDRHSRWVVYGFSPVLLAALVPLLRNYDVIGSSFWTEYALLIGSAIEIPILFYGLHRRMAQGRSANLRTSELRDADPLTGVSTAEIAQQKLNQWLGATAKAYQPFAVLAIDLTNCTELQKKYNRETADRALVMAGARIRSVARPADTVARIGDAQFALLLQGPINAKDANAVATKLLAAGLRATNELPQRDALRFHIAISDHSAPSVAYPGQTDALLNQLLAALREMNDGSGKAIRLLKL